MTILELVSSPEGDELVAAAELQRLAHEPRRGRYSHTDATLYILYEESRLKYTKPGAYE
jgi:hypothetical protein